MKIYTRTGDDGQTGLFGGSRVSKAALQISVVGELDALNASFGVAAVEDVDEIFVERIRMIQSVLFDIGAEVATVPEKVNKLATAAIGEEDVKRVETWIDESDVTLPPLRSFILPGGSRLAASLHRTRTDARRAERQLVALHESSEIGVRAEVLKYVNRLSDLCFTWAREANHRAQVPDVPWLPRS